MGRRADHVIHVVTAHVGSRWIQPQANYLRRHIRTAYRTIAVCDDGDEAAFDATVRCAYTQHAPRLDALARHVLDTAAGDDLIVFLDSDAFPISDPLPTVSAALEAGSALVAVRRDEGAGGGWPHPSFCATTVAMWDRLGSTWRAGHIPDPTADQRTDVGANLLRDLHGRPWTPLLRSNTTDRHPLFFGVYASIIYHHGAGSRRPWSVTDRLAVGAAGKERRIAETQAASDELYDALCANPDFWRTLDQRKAAT